MRETSLTNSTGGSAQPMRPYLYPVQRPGSATSSGASAGQKKIRLKVEASKLPKSKGKTKKGLPLI